MKTFLKIAVTLALVGALAYNVDWPPVVASLSGAHWGYLAAALALQLVTYLIGTFRWSVLLARHGLGHHTGNLLPPFFIGLWFNNLLPSASGGDLLRAFYIYQQRHGVAVAVSPIITERVLGLASLVGIATVAVTLSRGDNDITRTLATVVPLVFVGLVAGLFLVGNSRVYWPLHRFFERWQRYRVVDGLLNVAEAAHRYLNRPLLVLQLVALSALMQGVEIVVYWLLGESVGADVAFGHYFLVVPLIYVAWAVPITIGGLGVRETAAIILFGLYGMPQAQAAALMVLFFFILIATSLPGLYMFLRMKGHSEFLKRARHTEELGQ